MVACVLESHFDAMLVNARHVKNLPGRKTDVKDCEWLAQLLEHGLRGSFIPPRPIRELRDLTRHRKSLSWATWRTVAATLEAEGYRPARGGR